MHQFLANNRQAWQELESLVKKARGGRGLSRMTPEELARLDSLYRRTAVHLSQVAARTRDRRLLQYLNDLTAAAHAIIYLPPRRSMLAGVWSFLRLGFARSVAQGWRFHLASLLLFLLAGLAGYVVTMDDPFASHALLSAGEQRQMGADPALLEEFLRHGRQDGQGRKFAFAAFLFDNNLKVGLLSMASGVLAGVPTVFLILFNGMQIGVMSAAYHDAGLAWEWWAWILPHGVTELLAIVLSGGAGLQLGWAVLAPGLMSRARRLREAGRRLAETAAGIACMLVFAAAVEGFLRQSPLSNAARHAFAAGTWLFWFMYLWNGFRKDASAAKQP